MLSFRPATLDPTTTNMYPPPPDLVIQRLNGNVIETISYGKYVIHLTYESGNRLSIAAPFRFGSAAVYPNTPVNEFPISESSLMRTISCSIVAIRCEEDGTLELAFSNGDTLIVYANDPMYEAYTLFVDGSEYVV